jgi:hypothetical protein
MMKMAMGSVMMSCLSAMPAKAKDNITRLMPGEKKILPQNAIVECTDASLNPPKFRWTKDPVWQLGGCGIQFIDNAGTLVYGEVFRSPCSSNSQESIRSCVQNGNVLIYYCSVYQNRFFELQNITITSSRKLINSKLSLGSFSSMGACIAQRDAVLSICN